MNRPSLLLFMTVVIYFFNTYQAFVLRNASSDQTDYFLDDSDWNRKVNLLTKQVLDFLRSQYSSGRDNGNDQYYINEQRGYVQRELTATSSLTGQLRKRAKPVKSKKKGSRKRPGKGCVGRFGPLIANC